MNNNTNYPDSGSRFGAPSQAGTQPSQEGGQRSGSSTPTPGQHPPTSGSRPQFTRPADPFIIGTPTASWRGAMPPLSCNSYEPPFHPPFSGPSVPDVRTDAASQHYRSPVANLDPLLYQAKVGQPARSLPASNLGQYPMQIPQHPQQYGHSPYGNSNPPSGNNHSSGGWAQSNEPLTPLTPSRRSDASRDHGGSGAGAYQQHTPNLSGGSHVCNDSCTHP